MSTNAWNLCKGKADTTWQAFEQGDLPVWPLAEEHIS